MPGPNEIGCREARPLPEPPEEAIGRAAGTTGQVGARERVRDESMTEDILLEGGAGVVHGAEIFGAFEATAIVGAAASVALPFAAMVLMCKTIIAADHEVERRGEVYAGGRQLGALLVLEGRDGAPELLRLRAALAAAGDHDSLTRLSGILDGAAAANAWVDTHPCEARQLLARVRLSMNEGQLAVASGTDRGASFERRAARDPAFQDGVDYMRRLRDERPADFETRATSVRAMMSQVDSSRRAAARM